MHLFSRQSSRSSVWIEALYLRSSVQYISSASPSLAPLQFKRNSCGFCDRKGKDISSDIIRTSPVIADSTSMLSVISRGYHSNKMAQIAQYSSLSNDNKNQPINKNIDFPSPNMDQKKVVYKFVSKDSTIASSAPIDAVKPVKESSFSSLQQQQRNENKNSSTVTSKKENENRSDDDAILSSRFMPKAIIKNLKYGPAFLIWWTTVWGASMIGCLAIFGSSLSPVPPTVAVDLLKYIGSDYALQTFGGMLGKGNLSIDHVIAPATGNLLLAIEVNEFAELVRLPFVMATTPMVYGLGKRAMRALGKKDDGETMETKVRKYAKVFVFLYPASWLISFAGLYGTFEYIVPLVTGNHNTASALMGFFGLDLFEKNLNPEVGVVSITFIVNELFEVIRLPLVLAAVPRISRFLKR